MNKTVQLFRDNMRFMADKIKDQSVQFERLENILNQYPDEAYLLISEQEKMLLFSCFINLTKLLKTIETKKIEKLLQKLTQELYGIKGAKIDRKKF